MNCSKSFRINNRGFLQTRSLLCKSTKYYKKKLNKKTQVNALRDLKIEMDDNLKNSQYEKILK